MPVASAAIAVRSVNKAVFARRFFVQTLFNLIEPLPRYFALRLHSIPVGFSKPSLLGFCKPIRMHAINVKFRFAGLTNPQLIICGWSVLAEVQ